MAHGRSKCAGTDILGPGGGTRHIDHGVGVGAHESCIRGGSRLEPGEGVDQDQGGAVKDLHLPGIAGGDQDLLTVGGETSRLDEISRGEGIDQGAIQGRADLNVGTVGGDQQVTPAGREVHQ